MTYISLKPTLTICRKQWGEDSTVHKRWVINITLYFYHHKTDTEPLSHTAY